MIVEIVFCITRDETRLVERPVVAVSLGKLYLTLRCADRLLHFPNT